ncbi:uncharacterized protein LOC143747281 [Siphateles boraxobius]|uniref:uncharacterized protein LOC143747281 n=1 Tax=Siphateles boraxobius TaxID=180520 RepID=UPI00406341B9
MSVTEENVCSSGSHRNASQLFGPSNNKRLSVRRRAQGDSNSDGQDSEFSAEDHAVELDKILDECDTPDITRRTSYKMLIFGSELSGLYSAKRQDSNNVFKDKNKVNSVNKPTSNIHEKIMPPKDLLSCTNIEQQFQVMELVVAHLWTCLSCMMLQKRTS